MKKPNSVSTYPYTTTMTDIQNVWVVDDDKSIRWVLEKALTKEAVSITSFARPEKVLQQIKIEHPDVIISDIRMAVS